MSTLSSIPQNYQAYPGPELILATCTPFHENFLRETLHWRRYMDLSDRHFVSKLVLRRLSKLVFTGNSSMPAGIAREAKMRRVRCISDVFTPGARIPKRFRDSLLSLLPPQLQELASIFGNSLSEVAHRRCFKWAYNRMSKRDLIEILTQKRQKFHLTDEQVATVCELVYSNPRRLPYHDDE